MKKQIAISVGFIALALVGTYAAADSLFTASVRQDGGLIQEKPQKFKPGDIITVLVQETIDANIQADTKTKKDVSVEAQTPESANTFFVSPESINPINAAKLPNWSTETQNETKNTGRELRRSVLRTTVSCVVTDVFPNGTIALQGSKTVAINREDSLLTVSGIARARDVAVDNSIPSAKLANANIQLRGKGSLWNNQRRGWLTRALDWISPF
ncbi:MAG TPA: flagellar basal body L-ring protein FlgH [Candidatus Hydrogenedentes bacterium]|nr:flagellar basal body L-ring protein FlgH [Candidatus Hydrogenedentota bacterium]HPU97353.1 flagellar basal body L-ring protein FlgH [Candidatus Hydrogenedentota bacterium]